jgi:HD-GYP domain-containing protein (c-di-GMP phosphodiesterase class II)
MPPIQKKVKEEKEHKQELALEDVGLDKEAAAESPPEEDMEPAFHEVEEEVEELGEFAGDLDIPSESEQEVRIDSETYVQRNAIVSEGLGTISELVSTRARVDSSIFRPNAIQESVFVNKNTGIPVISTQDDQNFGKFMRGEVQSYTGSGAELAKWANGNRAQLESSNIGVAVSGNQVTFTNNGFDSNFAQGVIQGSEFEDFLAGKKGSFSGQNPTQAEWLVENVLFLKRHGITVQIEGEKYLLTTNGYIVKPVDPTLFSGSGFGGDEYEGFVDGHEPVYEGNDKRQAAWLLEHQHELAQAGISAYVELDKSGHPTGRFTLQNTELLPPNITPEKEAVLSRVVSDAQFELKLAQHAFKRAQELKSRGDEKEAGKYMAAAASHMQNAQEMLGTVLPYIEMSRLLYARRHEIDSFPAKEKGALQRILDNAGAYLSQTVTERGDEKLDSIQRSNFLMQVFESKLYLQKTKGILSEEQRTMVSGFIDKAVELFEKGTAAEFERAKFILGHAHSLTTLSLERAAVQAEYEGARTTNMYVHVEKMGLFHTDGKFDPEKFQKLTGVNYEAYQNGTRHSNRGMAAILSSIYSESLLHYENAVTELSSLVEYAADTEKPNTKMVSASLEAIQREKELGGMALARTATLDPLFRSLQGLATTVTSHLPSETDIRKLGISNSGMQELIDSRNAAMIHYRRGFSNVAGGFFFRLAAQNSQGEEREKHESDARKVLVQAERDNARFIRNAEIFNNLYGITEAAVSYIRSMAISEKNAQTYANELSVIGTDAIRKLRDDSEVVRSYFLRTVTDPTFLPDLPLPRRDSLIRNVEELGWDTFNAIYNDDATDGQVSKAARDLLATEITVTRFMGGMAMEGMYVPPVEIEEKYTLEKLLRSPPDKIVGFLGIGGFRASTWLKKEARALLPDIERLRDKPETFTADQRRELLLKIIKITGNTATNRALGSIEEYIGKTFKEFMDKNITYLNERSENLPKACRAIQTDINFLISHLRPSDIRVGKDGYGRPKLGFEDRMLMDNSSAMYRPTSVAREYEDLLRSVAGIRSIPEQMQELIPAVHGQLGVISREIAIEVGKAEIAYQEKLDEANTRKAFIAGGAILGGAIAAPFTAGQSFWASVGIISLGVGVGMALPSVTFAIQDYCRISADPKATPEDIAKARNKMLYEIGFAVVMVLPVIGHATKAWAIGRNALTLARLGYAAEIIGGLGMMGYGTANVVKGVGLIQEGETGWGVFNVTAGALMVFGGGMTTFSGVRGWTALNRLGRVGITPEVISIHLRNIERSNTIFQRMAAGKKVTITAERLRDINRSAKHIKDFIIAGGRLTVEQAKIYNAYRIAMVVQPAKDARYASRFNSRVKAGKLVSPEQFGKALAAKQRLENLSRVRALSGAEQKALGTVTRAIKMQVSRDLKLIAEFNKACVGGRAPTSIQVSSANAAYRRLALSEAQGSLTKKQAAELARYRQVLRSNAGEGVVQQALFSEAEMTWLRGTIHRLKLNPAAEQAALRNIDDASWLDPTNAGRMQMNQDRAATRLQMEEYFQAAARELGWSDDAVQKYSEAFVSLLDVSERNGYTTYGHTLRVARYTDLVLSKMNLSAVEKAKIRLAALIHDVGKIGVPNEVWRFAGNPSPAQKALIETHAQYSTNIADGLFRNIGLVDEAQFSDISKMAGYHQEFFDGTRYGGLKGEQIPLGSRIIALADTYDAIRSVRSYRPALSMDVAIQQFQRFSGTQFDPKIVPLFIEAINP